TATRARAAHRAAEPGRVDAAERPAAAAARRRARRRNGGERRTRPQVPRARREVRRTRPQYNPGRGRGGGAERGADGGRGPAGGRLMADLTGPIVMKFGGTSVADADAIVRVIRIVKAARVSSGLPPVVIVSAMSGVTDRIL